MYKRQDDERIGGFLACVSPLIIDCVRAVLASRGLCVKQKGFGTEAAFSIESPRGHVEFFLHNLLLDIATVDRDENPLRFDDRVLDRDFFVQKVARLIDSKLRVLFYMLRCDNFDQALKSMESLAGDYERLRVLRIDGDAGTKGGER